MLMAVLYFAGAPLVDVRRPRRGAGVAGVFYLAHVGRLPAGPAAVVDRPGGPPGHRLPAAAEPVRAGQRRLVRRRPRPVAGKWSYLPNADSDFIFAIIGEELGLDRRRLVLLLFALLAYTGMRIARRNVDPFVKIVAVGRHRVAGRPGVRSTSATSSGCCRSPGIPLPMISAGGTSLLITMVVFGLLANFARREPQAAAALQAGGGGRLAQFLGMRLPSRRRTSSQPPPPAQHRRSPRPRRRPRTRAARDGRAGQHARPAAPGNRAAAAPADQPNRPPNRHRPRRGRPSARATARTGRRPASRSVRARPDRPRSREPRRQRRRRSA